MTPKKALAVIWIDWYAYHVARFRAIVEHCSELDVHGIELVGKAGVHRGYEFRHDGRDGLAVETLFPDKSWHAAGQIPIALAVWKKLNHLNPSVVFVPGYYTIPAVTAAIWARLRGRRTVLMTESTEDDHVRARWKERCKALLIRALFNWSIGGGQPHVRYLKKLGFPPDRIGRFYNVVDNRYFEENSDRFRREDRSLDDQKRKPYFLFVGRLAGEKNILGLIRAFAAYRKNGGNWELLIAGDGDLRSAAQETARRLEIPDSIKWLGIQTGENLSRLYAFASCFVLPSIREPWGLVVNEALASGVPVIVSNRCGCVSDLVKHDYNGLIVDPFREESLTAALDAVAGMSEEARLAMAAASRKMVSRYSPLAWAMEVKRIALAS